MNYFLIGLIIIISILIFIIIHKFFRIVYFSFKGFLIELLTIIIISTYCSIIIIGKIGDILAPNSNQTSNSNNTNGNIIINELDDELDIEATIEKTNEDFYSKIESGTATVKDLIEYNSGGSNSFSANNFKDEVAWIQDVGNYYCIDTTGKILFYLNKNKFDYQKLNVTDFSNGIAVINNEYIIDKTGSIIFNITDNDYDTIILQGQYSNEIYNGLVFVEKTIETFDKTGKFIGVVGNDGDFIIDPTEEISFVKYIGDGLYYISNDNNENIYLNSKDMKFYRSSELNLFNEGRIEYYIDDQEWFFNSGNSMYEDASKEIGFLNKAGEKVLDLSEYNTNGKTIVNTPYFVGDYCILEIERDSTYWLTVINKLGERMFEPIVINNYSDIGEISNNLIRISNSDEHYFINIFGEVIINGINNATIHNDFSNGLCIVQAEEEIYYINEHGEKVIRLNKK